MPTLPVLQFLRPAAATFGLQPVQCSISMVPYGRQSTIPQMQKELTAYGVALLASYGVLAEMASSFGTTIQLGKNCPVARHPPLMTSGVPPILRPAILEFLQLCQTVSLVHPGTTGVTPISRTIS